MNAPDTTYRAGWEQGSFDLERVKAFVEERRRRYSAALYARCRERAVGQRLCVPIGHTLNPEAGQ